MAYKKIDPDAKAKWVAALRSGNYKQGQGCLMAPFKQFCCLGVLATEMGIKTRKTSFSSSSNYKQFVFPDGDIRQYDVPAGFCGLTEKQIDRLTDMNDEQHMTFDQIANWIQKNL